MLESIISNESLSLTEKEKQYVKNYPSKFKEEINKYFQDLEKEYSDSAIYGIINAYNFFGDDSSISQCFHQSIYVYYIQNIDDMVKYRRDFCIYTLMDIFFCHPLFFPTKNNNVEFVEKTYPILFLRTDNMSSYIAIASMRFIAILENEVNGRFFLKKYLKETEDNNYEEEVLEALEDD